MTETSDIIKIIIENWGTIKNISKDTWKKIQKLFKEGDKSLGFIRRKNDFYAYIELSRTEFLRKYAKYIIPTEYRGYLLESLVICKLFNEGKVGIAEEKRIKIHSVNPKALRMHNLNSSGMLYVLYSTIDRLISEGRNEQEITGIASKYLDDLINDKSIIYVNQWHNEKELYEKIKSQLKQTSYCIIYGSGDDNTNKIKEIFDELVDDEEMSLFEIRLNKSKIGLVNQFNLFIVKKI